MQKRQHIKILALAQMLDQGQTIQARIENTIPENNWEPMDVVMELVV